MLGKMPYPGRHLIITWAHLTSLGYRTLEIIPGTTIRNTGRILIHPVRMVAPWASDRDLADRAFWTIIYL